MTREEAMQLDWVQEMCKDDKENRNTIVALAASGFSKSEIQETLDMF